MFLLAGGTENGIRVEKVKKKTKTDMRYDSAEENSAQEKNNKPIQVVLVYQTDTTNNVHTIG